MGLSFAEDASIGIWPQLRRGSAALQIRLG